MKIALIGTGAYGTAIAAALSKKNKDITLLQVKSLHY